MINQATSLREQGVMECIHSGYAGVSKELLVTASDVSKCLVLWRLFLEYIHVNLIILRMIFNEKLCTCVNSVYQAVFLVLGKRLYGTMPGPIAAPPPKPHLCAHGGAARAGLFAINQSQLLLILI